MGEAEVEATQRELSHARHIYNKFSSYAYDRFKTKYEVLVLTGTENNYRLLSQGVLDKKIDNLSEVIKLLNNGHIFILFQMQH